MDEVGELAVLHAFLRRLHADRVAGTVRTAAEYAALFPGHAATIEREYAAALAPVPVPVPAPAPTTGERVLHIGPYAVVRELGRGGQAVVYLARDGRLHRDVALKVLPRVHASLEQQLRLEREALTAARLEDSGICPVYEIGHDGGYSFVAMRYVAGETLAEVVARPRAGGNGPVLPLPQLLELFERVCSSLHRAHEAGVVHRDVKPANVMIAADGAPVLLDFGLAADRDSDGPLLTRTGDVFGTPAYLAPERLRGVGAGAGNDRRGDVWAIGVSLYEACTLQRPFQAATLEGLYAAILTEEPVPLRRLAPALPADLASVVAVCLEKDPERRYHTAADLAADLRAVRLGEPIRGRPPSLLRRCVRWHRRRAALATASWLLLAGLAATIAVQRVMLGEVRSARDDAQSINDFLVERLLLALTPREARGQELTVAEVFDRAGRNVVAAFPRPSRVAGLLHHVLGRAYEQIGRPLEAKQSFERAVAIRTDVLGPDARETLQSRRHLAMVQYRRDDFAGALETLHDVLARQRTSFGDDDADVLATRRSLSQLLVAIGRSDEAEGEARAVLAARERALPAEHESVLDARHWLARCLTAQGRRAEAEALYREVLAVRRRVLGPDAIDVEASLTDLATLLHDRASYEHLADKWAQAEAAYAEQLQLAQRLYPKSNPAYATAVNNVASFWCDRAEHATEPAERAAYQRRAEALFRESLALREASDGPDSTRVAIVCSNLASLLAPMQRYDEALQLLERALAIRERVNGRDHVETLKVLNNRGVVLTQAQGAAAALPVLADALERARGNPNLDTTLRNIIENCHVVTLFEAGRDVEAVAAIEAFLPRASAQWGAASRDVRGLAQRTAAALRRLGREDEARAWDERAQAPPRR